jgi:hypothetical protein
VDQQVVQDVVFGAAAEQVEVQHRVQGGLCEGGEVGNPLLCHVLEGRF